MMKQVLSAAILAVGVAAPAAAQTQGVPVAVQGQNGVEGKLSFTIKAGLETHWGGNVHDAGSGTILGLPAEVESRNWNDAYDPGFRFSVGIGYGFSPRMEGIAAFSYGVMGAKEMEVGTVAGLPLEAQFADYEDWTLEGGVRYYFAPDRSFNPYLSGVFGIRNIDAIPGTFSVPDVNVTFEDVGFYNDSTVFMWGIDFGAQWRLTDNTSFGVESGFRWQASPGEVEGFAGTGLEGLNDAGSRFVLPILGTLTFHFD
jgi:hypothetical protein